ncbi:MAG: PDZ domain-containing protein [Acidobacteriota bacterium]
MNPWFRPLLYGALLTLGATPTLAQGTVGTLEGIVEEDLEDTGFETLPLTLPEIDEAALLQSFQEAEAIFHSPEQDASLPAFGDLVETLQPRADANQLSAPMRDILIRSLAYRAQLHFNFEELDLVEEGLTRMLRIDPQSDLDRSQASPKLVTQFDRLRRRLLGEITFVLEPTDAKVHIDGRQVDAALGPVAVFAGQRQIDITLPGYESIARQLQVEPDVSITLELELVRVSAVVRLATRPAGATVLIGGVPQGQTTGVAPEGFLPQGPASRYRREEFSEELVIEGIELGLVLLEVQLAGHRTQRFELPISELLDYPLPPIVFERERGSLQFNNFPSDAEIRVDGELKRLDNPGARKPQLTLAPGSYHVTVATRSSKMFSTQLQVADRQRIEVDVDLRPGLAFLGVLGGDRETARNLDQSLRVALADSGKWTLINRASKAPTVLAQVGITAESLRTLESESAAGSRSSIDWQQVQATVDHQVPGLVYVVAVPSNDLVATHATVWIWPRAPGPREPDRVRIPLGDPQALADLKRSFNRTIRLQRPWVGALVIDTNGAPHPLVVEVTPASPAENAGLRVGDLIVGVAGVPVTSRAAFDERIDAAEIGETLEVGVQSPDGSRSLNLQLGASPDLLATTRGDLFDSVAYTELVLLSERTAPELAWIVELDQALIQLRANAWTEAARQLRSIRAPQNSHGVGQATVDYLLGIALSGAGSSFREGARQHFEKAAGVAGARLFHNDGAWVAPRARARLLAIGG